MGHSVTCTFQVEINLSNGASPIYGAMSLKDVKGLLLSEKEYQATKGHAVVNAVIWPQTARGRNFIHKDFAIMTPDGKIDHFKCGDPVPFYCF